ncbi:transcription factor bHLH106-like [Telopea speciosissima]|uniref:transcription factor bHLH106-like n=1 Tax=Telopea speciosissima TaxID=54955 RepID=UPI001CC76A02|nr:transcription factor bHLH106-like [Telopea speciosissima]
MQSNNSQEGSELYQIITGAARFDVGSYGFPANYEFTTIPNVSGGSQSQPLEMSRITEMPQARALVASRNHKEAEKRRRERINSHLDRLRGLLPCNSKTDKASLLAMVIQHVKELKQQTSKITELELFPSENDEIAVFSGDFCGRSILNVTVCCENRSDLLPDLIQTLKLLRLKTLRAEMATLGGRMRNVLIVTGEDCSSDESIDFLRDALKSVVERSSSADVSKRRRIDL